MRFQDERGPLGDLGVFHDGRLVSDTTADIDDAYWIRNRLAERFPGCEVLAICPAHPDRAAVDCLDCWPEEAS